MSDEDKPVAYLVGNLKKNSGDLQYPEGITHEAWLEYLDMMRVFVPGEINTTRWDIEQEDYSSLYVIDHQYVKIIDWKESMKDFQINTDWAIPSDPNDPLRLIAKKFAKIKKNSAESIENLKNMVSSMSLGMGIPR